VTAMGDKRKPGEHAPGGAAALGAQEPRAAPIKPYKKRPPMPHHRGVSWYERKEKWFAYTSKVDGKQKFLGYRELFNDAVQLRLDWEAANARCL
jgi:hypothetical protein